MTGNRLTNSSGSKAPDNNGFGGNFGSNYKRSSMNKLSVLLFLTLGLLSCNDNTEKTRDNKPMTADQEKTKLDKIKLDFNQPVLIDSSDYVMYPLTLEHIEESTGSYSSNSYGSTTYWNILFYNTVNGEYHLLNDSIKMVIYSYNSRNERGSELSSSASFNDKDFFEGGYNQVGRLLYFSITTTDFNKDGKLNSTDPSYLFIADKAGKHFKQISPDGLDVRSWECISGANKILLMVTKDSNNDKIFSDKDESFPLVYDLTRNTTSAEILPDDYKIKLKKKLDEQWLKKE
jgi:hypothetical protein